mgnify:CR=1 FL=1
MFRRIAVSRLHLPDGTVRCNQVIELENGKVVSFYALTEELPYTEWLGGDFVLSEDSTVLTGTASTLI